MTVLLSVSKFLPSKCKLTIFSHQSNLPPLARNAVRRSDDVGVPRRGDVQRSHGSTWGGRFNTKTASVSFIEQTEQTNQMSRLSRLSRADALLEASVDGRFEAAIGSTKTLWNFALGILKVGKPCRPLISNLPHPSPNLD